ncbi:uncharacterized protein [Chlorocebus sabaeus]|uniref:uncharacterized protein n=1 Tax=Chlorocebus sabaeus TaxID=60711 RepID=UPI003BF9AB53
MGWQKDYIISEEMKFPEVFARSRTRDKGLDEFPVYSYRDYISLWSEDQEVKVRKGEKLRGPGRLFLGQRGVSDPRKGRIAFKEHQDRRPAVGEARRRGVRQVGCCKPLDSSAERGRSCSASLPATAGLGPPSSRKTRPAFLWSRLRRCKAHRPRAFLLSPPDPPKEGWADGNLTSKWSNAQSSGFRGSISRASFMGCFLRVFLRRRVPYKRPTTLRNSEVLLGPTNATQVKEWMALPQLWLRSPLQDDIVLGDGHQSQGHGRRCQEEAQRKGYGNTKQESGLLQARKRGLLRNQLC